MPVASEREAHIEGAKNLYRYNRVDIFNIGVWLAFVLATVVIVFLVGHVIALGHHPVPSTCHSVAACNRYILSHPVHGIKTPPGFPIYHPITPTTVG